VAIKIKKTGNVHEDGIKCLVYGKGGIGKTTLMGTAPKPIVLSCESGMLALADKNIPYIEIQTVEEIYEAYDYLMSSKGKRYETICLDSVSEIAELVLSDLKKQYKDARQAYGELAEEVTTLVRKFRDIKGKNVIFSAKQKRITDEDTGLTQYVASMPGNNLTNSMPFFFDEVFYMTLHEKDDGKEVRVLKTQTSFDHDAKDRSGKLKKLELPNLTRIFNKISKGDK